MASCVSHTEEEMTPVPPAPAEAPEKKRCRAKTRKCKPLSKEERAEYADEFETLEIVRPETRAKCRQGIRPCPFVSCKFHLYLDVNPRNGHVKYNFPHLEPWELDETCSLDIAEREQGITLEEVGKVMNLTRERVRQVEVSGLAKIRVGGPLGTTGGQQQ